MKMDYSVAKQFGSKIPQNKVSTEEIKAGLERIKKAQEQVLQQLKKNHPDYSIDVRTTNSQMYHLKTAQNQNLKRQLTVQRERSTEKSTLYRRRVVDLESSLALHAQHQQKLKAEYRMLNDQNKALQSQNRALQQQLRAVKQKYAQLQKDYQRLIEQSQKSNRNLRILQKQVIEFNKKLQEDDIKSLRNQFEAINNERNSIMTQKITLLKNYSKLQSENIELKLKIAALPNEKQKQRQVYLQKEKQIEVQIQRLKKKQLERSRDYQLQKQKILKGQNGYSKQQRIQLGNINALLGQILKMNSCHQHIFTTLKQNTKLSRGLIDKQNAYQNSLNRILQMLYECQGNMDSDRDMPQFRFDHEQSFKEQVKRIQLDLLKKHKKQVLKYTTQKQQLSERVRSRDKKLEELKKENQQLDSKLNQARKQKTQLLQQIKQLNGQIGELKQNLNKNQKIKYEQQRRKQHKNQQEYREIINNLNEQMGTIQRQKKDLDGLVKNMANNKTEEQIKNRKKLAQIVQKNKQIMQENQKIKEKYEAVFIQKQHLYINMTDYQNKNTALNKQIAKEIMQKERLIAQLNKLKQEKDLFSVQIDKFRILSQNTRKDAENVNNSYLLEIERLIHESLHLRQQIELLTRDRNELRELKSKYEMLMRDNQMLGKKTKYANSQIDHLWMIKEVQYNNLNNVINELKPL